MLNTILGTPNLVKEKALELVSIKDQFQASISVAKQSASLSFDYTPGAVIAAAVVLFVVL